MSKTLQQENTGFIAQSCLVLKTSKGKKKKTEEEENQGEKRRNFVEG